MYKRQLTDHLGTVRAVVDAVGAIVNQTTYDSFGQVLVETNSLFGDRYKFTGRELNSGSDYYYRARTYNARSGRFGALDSIRFRGGTANLYSYTLNSPASFTDPTGNFSVVSYGQLAFGGFLVGCAIRVLVDVPEFEFMFGTSTQAQLDALRSRAEAQVTGVVQRATVGVVAAPVAAIGVGLFAISFGLVTTAIGAANFCLLYTSPSPRD